MTWTSREIRELNGTRVTTLSKHNRDFDGKHKALPLTLVREYVKSA